MQIIGQNLFMIRKEKNKSGFSLAEISIAVLIFALCAIPLYYAVSYGSAEEIHLEKTAIANKILESFRDEIKNLDFETAKQFSSFSGNSGLPPETFKVVNQVVNEKHYKDYVVSCTCEEKTEHEIKSITFKPEIKWKNNKNKEITQKITFVIIEK